MKRAKPNIYVLYHADKDGQGSAYVCWRVFGDEAKYIPVQYKDKMPHVKDGSEVYIVDFSYSKEELIELSERMSKVVVLDHHKTALDNLKDLTPRGKDKQDNLVVCFDMKSSGVGMTWNYFFPDSPLPKILACIQDRDLWKFDLPDTKTVHEFLSSREFKLHDWDYFVQHMAFEDITKEGEAILRSKEREIEYISKDAGIVEFANHKAVMVNSGMYPSEVGNYLLDKFPEAKLAVVYCKLVSSGKTIYSLRSKGNFDVSEIAKKHGGGGHKNAAGFIIKNDVNDRFFCDG